MTRRQWMWLWIWLLLFFIIFCVWNKLQTLTSDLKTQTQPITNTASVPIVSPTTTQAIEKVEDINLKIVKDGSTIKISGLFSSKEDLDTLKSIYLKTFENVEEDLIVFDKNAQNSKIIELVSSISEDFAKFKNGYLEYADKKFTIDGIVNEEDIKKSIGKKVVMVGDILVDNRVIINQPKIEKVEKSKEPSIIEIQEKLNKLLKVKNVEFIFANDKLTPNGKKTVNEVYTVLSKYENMKIEISGHTDSIGTLKNNRALSQNRANAIKSYLISKGIKSERLNAVGYGESKSLVQNNSSKNRQINRRVEFKIIGE